MKNLFLISALYFASVQGLSIPKVTANRLTIDRPQPIGGDRCHPAHFCENLADEDVQQSTTFHSTKNSSLVTPALAFLLASSLSLASLPATATEASPPPVSEVTTIRPQEEKSLGKQAGEWFFLAYVGFSTRLKNQPRNASVARPSRPRDSGTVRTKRSGFASPGMTASPTTAIGITKRLINRR